MNPLDKPIIACCSGNSDNSAVSIIRISGFSDLQLFQPLFRRPLIEMVPWKVGRNTLYVQNNDLDNVLLTFFRAPKSYTGENILELYVHGNRLHVERLIDLFVDRCQCCYAAAGEFTYRAYKNRKLSLSQVEGLELFLNATGPAVAQSGFSLLQGDLNQKYLSLRALFLEIKRCVEMLIDFAEDVGEELIFKQLKDNSALFSQKIGALWQRCQLDCDSIRHPSIVIYGATNAGKSVFFNRLLGSDRSIVSSRRGTTRDYVSENIKIAGTSFRLIDTAGLRGATDQIEQEGISRSLNLLKQAFCKILVVNPLQKVDDGCWSDADFVVFSHCDLPQGLLQAKTLARQFCGNKPFFYSGPIGPVDAKGGSIGPLSQIFTFIGDFFAKIAAGEPILVVRHKVHLEAILKEFNLFHQELLGVFDIGILDNYLENINGHLHQLVGIISTEEILTSIFDNYCIGK